MPARAARITTAERGNSRVACRDLCSLILLRLTEIEGRSMANKMWGGRFQSAPDAIMEEINASIGFDQRLFRQDIAGSKAHVAMLAGCGIIGKQEAAEIRRGLEEIEKEITSGKFTFSRAL